MMAIFPDITPSFNIVITPVYNTLKLGPTDGDFIQRRRKRLTPLFQISLKWDLLTEDEEKQLYEFFIARYGIWEAFSFFDPILRKWADIKIGTGDGFQTVFNLKAKETSDRAIKVDGVTKTEGVDYTFSAGTGTDGQDRITFTSAPAVGAVITANYRSKLYFPKCIFQDDYMDRDVFSYRLYTTGLFIQEVSE
jgi:hypothetical protein